MIKPLAGDKLDNAFLQSRNYASATTLPCVIIFYYHMYAVSINFKKKFITNAIRKHHAHLKFNGNMGSLNLYKTTFANGAYELLWNVSDNQGNSWKRTYLEIKSTAPFKVTSSLN